MTKKLKVMSLKLESGHRILLYYFLTFLAFGKGKLLLSGPHGPSDWQTANQTCWNSSLSLLEITTQEMEDYLAQLLGDFQ